jgi:hypothetical protein
LRGSEGRLFDLPCRGGRSPFEAPHSDTNRAEWPSFPRGGDRATAQNLAIVQLQDQIVADQQRLQAGHRQLQQAIQGVKSRQARLRAGTPSMLPSLPPN